MTCIIYLLYLFIKMKKLYLNIYPLINVINQAGTNQMKARAINNRNILVLLSLVGGPSNKTKYLSPSFPAIIVMINTMNINRETQQHWSLIADHWLVTIILLARSHGHIIIIIVITHSHWCLSFMAVLLERSVLAGGDIVPRTALQSRQRHPGAQTLLSNS